MKKLIAAAIAVSLVSAPAFAAPGNRYDRAPAAQSHYQPAPKYNGHQQQVRHWKKGERFDRRYASNYREVSNYGRYHLKAPPRGYHYVQSGNDALLVGITSGIISAVLSGVIR